MKRRRLLILMALAVLCVAVATAGAVCIWHQIIDPPVSTQSALSGATLWARLAPLPASARNVQVDVKGSIFSREFVISFDASAVVIQRWVVASPGPSSAIRRVAGPITTYAITPGGGAEFAEVKVDGRLNRVVICTYWS